MEAVRTDDCLVFSSVTQLILAWSQPGLSTAQTRHEEALRRARAGLGRPEEGRLQLLQQVQHLLGQVGQQDQAPGQLGPGGLQGENQVCPASSQADEEQV